MELVNVRNLEKFYYVENRRTMKREKVSVIKNISMQIAESEAVCIMGRSGSGKTTLLKMLGTLLTPSGGSVYYEGKNLSELTCSGLEKYRRTQVGFIFQDYKLLKHMTIRDNMMLPLMLEHRNVKESVCKVEEMADSLQIYERLDYYPDELSGGEKQRAAIGRALMNEPKLILADEPTGNLDSVSGKCVMELLMKLQREWNKTLILVTHDKKIAEYCNRIVRIVDGEIAEEQEVTHG